MTQLFRSKSCGLSKRTDFDSSPPSPSLYHHHHRNNEEPEDDDDDDEDDERENEEEEEEEYDDGSPISTPLIVPSSRERKSRSSSSNSSERRQQNHQQFQILTIFVEALRKSVATCGVEKDDICSLDISSPTDVRHVSHVTFDRFNGFLGLPVEFKPKVPTRVPSASSSVFGVSAESMKCSYDQRGNSVPTILLMMQRRLYLEGGLQTEGIFRINAENTQEEFVRDQLNKGIVKQGIDVHCLAGLIKAWFRELPAGVLDTLTPDQVMHCNTEEECMQLMMLLQPTEASLLRWAINLMADVVKHENRNKMNARNIAMVFAPNMTQMADPLTALIHAVQVMNFLRTLIVKTIRERAESGAVSAELSPCPESANNINDHNPLMLNSETRVGSCEHPVDDCVHDTPESGNLRNFLTRDKLETDIEQNTWNLQKKGDDEGQNITPVKCEMGTTENECRDGYTKDAEGFLDRLSLRKGVRKLRKHPVFQLSKSVKKSAEEVDI